MTHVPNNPRRAFTLMELLVVMGIMILLIALALPAFRFMTGSRSEETGVNSVAAALSVARAKAIGLQEIRGVAVYRDTVTDRVTAATVSVRDLEAVGTWAAGSPLPGTPISRYLGEYVRQGTDFYVCVQSHTDVGDPSTDLSKPQYWRVMPNANTARTKIAAGVRGPAVELEVGVEMMTLPTGIDVRSAARTSDYQSPSLFLFDASGQLLSTPFVVIPDGLLGRASGLSPLDSGRISHGLDTNPPDATNCWVGTSGVGLVLFNAELFKNTGRSTQWLDENATPAMINRYNGTLTKGD